MTQQPYLADKPIGATPLQALTLVRRARILDDSVKLSYAGRLDPLASGLLVILHGDMLKHQEDYWYLSKEYDATMLLGIRTDSYDVMGMPTVVPVKKSDSEPQYISAALRGMVGKFYLSVPAYSSLVVDGKALFAWARSDTGLPPAVPVRRMSVSQIDINEITSIDHDALLTVVRENIARVHGDFRQDAIIEAWDKLTDTPAAWPIVRMSIRCASGTYIRSLANELGRRLNGGALLLQLRRTRVGSWHVRDDAVTRLSWPQ